MSGSEMSEDRLVSMIGEIRVFNGRRAICACVQRIDNFTADGKKTEVIVRANYLTDLWCEIGVRRDQWLGCPDTSTAKTEEGVKP